MGCGAYGVWGVCAEMLATSRAHLQVVVKPASVPLAFNWE